MALEANRVSGSVGAGAVAAPTRYNSSGAPLATDKIDATSPGSFNQVAARWQADQDGSGGNRAPVFTPPTTRSWLTPLIFRAALGFAAVAPLQSDYHLGGGPSFLTDLQRGVGIYETNMKLLGLTGSQGNVVNQYS